MQTPQERILPDEEKQLQLLLVPTHNEGPINTIKNQYCKELARADAVRHVGLTTEHIEEMIHKNPDFFA